MKAVIDGNSAALPQQIENNSNFSETTRMQVKSTAMKAMVPALFAASLTGTAFAQSNVTVFGVMDLALTHGSGSISNRTGLDSGQLAASRLAFKGTEDLGSGLKAGFWLEMGINADTGTGQGSNTNNQTTGFVGNGTFNRRSHLSLGGNWGEIRLGRDFVPQYWNIVNYDALELSGVGTSQVLMSSIGGPTTVRASNSVSYLYGHGFNAAAAGYGPGGFSGSGFQFHAMYYLGENSSGPTSDDGDGYGLRAQYSTGKFTVSGATGRTSYAAGDTRQTNAATSYDFGVVHVMGMYEWDENGPLKARGWTTGVQIPAGVGQIQVAYSRYGSDAAGDPTARKWAARYVHRLSKRTALYAAVAHVSNDGPSASALNGAVTAAGKSSNGYDFGIKHSF